MLASRFDSRRRASVAVWSDDKLMKFAQNAVNHAAAKESKMQISTAAKSECSLDSDASEVAPLSSSTYLLDSSVFFGLTPYILAHVFRFLSFRQLMRLRRLNSSIANLLLERPHSLVSFVDLSHWHKMIDNKVIGDIMCFCGPNITMLSLRNCWQITDQGLARIAQYATNLHTLSLSTVWDITETGLNSIAEHCKQLRAIDLSNCRKLNDAGVQNLLDKCKHLDTIGLSYCKSISDSIMDRSIWSCMRRINFRRCTGLFDAGFLKWRDCYLKPQLPLAPSRGVQPLGWSHPVINDVISENESELTDVRHGEQSLDANSMMDTDAPQSEIDTNHTQTTDAMDVTADGDHEPTAPGSHLPQDQPMHMSTYTEVPESLSNPIRLAFMLEELNLSDCSFLTDQTIAVLSACCPRLERLCLSFCCSLTEKYAEILAKGCWDIHTLDVSYCGGAVTDASLSTLAHSLSYLEQLSIRGCVQVTDAGVDALLHESTRLAALNLSQCKSISQEAIHRASQVCELMTQQSFFEEIVFMPYVVANRRVRAATAPISHVYPKASHDLK
ncbi:hypothetical protein BASA60_007799 [Batrachochytrium salamandrivorans]|nr:hypothetical protein BASA60_007799 [Batrachochytrium salamandrivorans]